MARTGLQISSHSLGKIHLSSTKHVANACVLCVVQGHVVTTMGAVSTSSALNRDYHTVETSFPLIVGCEQRQGSYYRAGSGGLLET